jgi:hypothetical protein
MIQNDDIAKWTEELIESELESGELANILRICDENFELWTQKLFPVLQAQGKPCYRAVVQLLHRAGCMNANEKMLGTYFSYLRKKRGLTKQTARAPSLTQTRSVDVVPTPVGVSPVAAPVGEAQPSSYQVQPSRPVPVQADEVAYPHVYAKASLTPPVDYEDMREELERWKSEASLGWVADWTGVDEFVWLDFLDRIEEFNRYNSPKWTVTGNHVKFKNEIGQQQLKEAFDLLKKKVVKQRRA